MPERTLFPARDQSEHGGGDAGFIHAGEREIRDHGFELVLPVRCGIDDVHQGLNGHHAVEDAAAVLLWREFTRDDLGQARGVGADVLVPEAAVLGAEVAKGGLSSQDSRISSLYAALPNNVPADQLPPLRNVCLWLFAALDEGLLPTHSGLSLSRQSADLT